MKRLRKIATAVVSIASALAFAAMLMPGTSYAQDEDPTDPPVVGGSVLTAYRSWDHATRLETSTALAREFSTKYGGTPDGVVVVNGWSATDTMVASGLAGNLGYALVYSGPWGFGSDAMADIDAMAPSHVVVVGGTSALPDAAISGLASRPYVTSFTRVWGADRYATAAAVWSYGATSGSGWSDTAILISGAAYADGASAATLAAYGRMPVILTSGSSIPSSEAQAVSGAKSFMVVGGEAVVPQAVLDSLPDGLGVTAIRLAGADRYATSRAVAAYEVELREPNPDGGTQRPFGYETMYLVKGGSYADAVAIGTNSSVFPAYPVYRLPSHEITIGRPIVVMADNGHSQEFAEQVYDFEYNRPELGRFARFLDNAIFTGNAFSYEEIEDFCSAVNKYHWIIED